MLQQILYDKGCEIVDFSVPFISSADCSFLAELLVQMYRFLLCSPLGDSTVSTLGWITTGPKRYQLWLVEFWGIFCVLCFVLFFQLIHFGHHCIWAIAYKGSCMYKWTAANVFAAIRNRHGGGRDLRVSCSLMMHCRLQAEETLKPVRKVRGEKILALLPSLFGYLYRLIRSLWFFSSPGWTVPALSAFPCMWGAPVILSSSWPFAGLSPLGPYLLYRGTQNGTQEYSRCGLTSWTKEHDMTCEKSPL